jgi:RimJ/RimL family protein N-acetyltransferase
MPYDITPTYVEGLNDPKVHEFMTTKKHDLASVWAYVTDNWNDPCAILFGIYAPILIGTLRLHYILEGGSATMGICIFDKRYWGKGVGRSAIARVIEFGASELHLREINAGIEAGNVGSQRAFEMAGFTRIADKAAAHQYRWSAPE